MDDNMFTKFIDALTPGINASLADLLPPEEGPALVLRNAMRYAVLNGGKRLRPALCIASFSTYGTDAALVLGVACALEFAHCFTLIHDDMPCMDNDDLRRGKPTVHKAYNESVALLAGDALHNLAYQVLVRHCADKLEPQIASIVMQTFAKAIGKVCDGQMSDIESAGKPIEPELLRFIHENKTASLIWASIICGAVCANTPAHHLAALSEFADAAGLLFQNVDDILDVCGDVDTTGKTGSGDSKLKKMTTVSSMGLEGAAQLAVKQRNLALQSISSVDNCAVLESFVDYVYSRIPEKLR